MHTVVFEGPIPREQASTISLRIHLPGQEEQDDEITGMGLLDIGSKHCILNEGVLDDKVFNQSDGTRMRDSAGRDYLSRFRELVIRLKQDDMAKEFLLPVYVMPIGQFPHGTRVMLIGRTLLNQGTLMYDGPNQKWSLSFPE
jgi:hypothetical protein